jgi:sugar lactone lactonase YvrE
MPEAWSLSERRLSGAQPIAEGLGYYPGSEVAFGEAPVWDSRSEALYWVDCQAKQLLCLEPDTGRLQSRSLPHFPGSYAVRASGGLLMAYRNGLACIELDSGAHTPIPTHVDFDRERFNDGKCDRKGRFWVGTMDRKLEGPAGALYRVDADLSVQRVLEGFVVSNGIAFSPDDRTMYHTDSRRGLIFAYEYDCDRGIIGNQRTFLQIPEGQGRPDGCTVDAEGHLWVSEIGAGRIGRFDPSGRRVRTIELPVRRPSSVMFGGGDLRTLYAVSMRYGCTEQELREKPLAGCLFVIDAGVAGLPEPHFAG